MKNSQQIREEFIRLVDNEPMVLKVSALADFLWQDFVRDSSPRVKYLSVHYDIKKLSRFGKELFEALYQGDNLNFLVDLEKAEDRLGDLEQGEEGQNIEGYKPENAFWIGLFLDVINSPAWHSLAPLCYGSQFNAGNNAVCILNRLSEVLSEQIENTEINPQLLGEGAEELKEIRRDYVQAKKDGDSQRANELRQAGKELGKQLEQYQNEIRREMRPQVQDATNKAMEEAKSIKNAIENLSGDQKGTHKTKSLEEERALATRLRENKALLKLANRLGALRRSWNQRKRAVMGRSDYSDIVGVKFSDSVVQALPTELALANTEEGRALFALKYSQKTILSKDYEAPVKNLDRGPIIMYVDISGSMHGEDELWSKAMAIVVAEEALKQKRSVHLALFDTQIRKEFHFDPTTPNKEALLSFCLSWSCNGGTDFENVLHHAMENMDGKERADILMITDGHDNVQPEVIEEFLDFRERFGIQMNTFCIGDMSETVKLFSDDVRTVDVSNDGYSSELFQAVLI